MVVVPPVGGGTLYADLQEAYDDLSPAMQEYCGGVKAAHSTQTTPFGRGLTSGDVFDPTDFVAHPLVVTHPETGRKGLYLSSRITHLIDIPTDESTAMLAFLKAHASGPTYQFKMQWNAGD